MPPLSQDRLAALLRRLYGAYRERFEELAPAEDPPMPFLAQQSLDLVSVNGGRALHFFFTTPEPGKVVEPRRVTRVHDITLWPPTTDELKSLAGHEPQQHREQVRKTAEIEGSLYVHFILWPEDGALEEIVAEVGARVAEREVRRATGEHLSDEVPGVAKIVDSKAGGKDRDPAGDWIHPEP